MVNRVKVRRAQNTKNKSNIDRDQETLQGRIVSMSSVDDYLGECLVELEVQLIIWSESDPLERMKNNPPTCFAVKSEDITPWS